MYRVFVFCSLLITATPMWSAVICVPDATPGGCDSTQPTLQLAVDNSIINDTVRIAAGVYLEAVIVDQALFFEGAGSGATIITPPAGNSAMTVSGDLGAANTLAFTGIEFQGATESGIAIGAGDLIGGLVIDNCAFIANERNGLSIVDGSGVDNVIVQDSVFSGNGEPQASSGDGDLLFFQYEGDATLSNLLITGQDRGNGPAENGIQFRDDDGALGNVTLSNIVIAGIYEKQPLALFNYNDITALSAANVSITADSLGFQLAANFDGIGGLIDFQGLDIDTSSAPDPVALQGDASDNVFIDGDGDNFFRGFGGDDIIDVGPGNDIVGYVGDSDDYIVTDNGDGTVTVVDGNPLEPAALPDEGTDTIIFNDELMINFTAGAALIVPDPVPSAQPVPTLGIWGLVLLLLTIGLAGLRLLYRQS